MIYSEVIAHVVYYAGHGGLVVRSRHRDRKVSAFNPIPLKIRHVLGLLHAKSYAVAKRPPDGMMQIYHPGPAYPRRMKAGRGPEGRESPHQGFIKYNKMIQALPDMVLPTSVWRELLDLQVLNHKVWRMILTK
ncbi:hypothetical protein AVEN_63343-1 [Araneus ventricosus]|uniref:Uncharacterized protein n=1 Tax=Araneus ventricosus TaxID=182803 RepID=A0A4Y2QB64_ARAVE|nr:hypothetical protein AVEN_63343-1 [Araneus ventricosus]